MAITQDIA